LGGAAFSAPRFGLLSYPALAAEVPRPSQILAAPKLTPSSPENVLRDVIAPALEKVEVEWHGFHAFRRGLATNLRALGVDDLTIKEILRHSDVSVITRASYIKRIDEKSIEAMDRFEAELCKPVQSVKGKARKADTVVACGHGITQS
jgi:integrase